MVSTADITRAQVVLTNLPDTKCFTSWQDFLQALPEFLGVEIPVSSITNVVVSNIEPSSSQTTSIWFRLGNDGGFIGIYVFSQGAWQAIYPVNIDSPVNANQIFWFYGDALNPPPGFINTNDATYIDAGTKAYLAGLWQVLAGVSVYYSAVYNGF